MSYLVLARKWRPQTFADLIGQDHVSQTLGNSIRTGRIHHAFLFTGARGVGKTSAARILAKALNCEKELAPEPCNECPSCHEIANGQGIDVFEIDGASNTGVDDIRELRENIRYLPSRSRHKIFIIDEVHMLSINAFNALLKTLEEPPPHAKFIFATTEPHKIPVTILSRCQRFDFRKISLPKMTARLQEIVAAEGIGISAQALAMVARRGEGSMRDALSTLDQVIAFCGLQVADEDVQGLLGMIDRRLILETVEAALQRDSRRLLEAVRRVDQLGHSFRQFCQELVETFRGLILCRVLEDPGEHLDTTPDELRQLRTLADAASLEDLQRALTLLIRTEVDVISSAYPRLILEMSLVRLASLPPARDIASLIRKVDELAKLIAAGGVLPQAQAAEGAAPPKKNEAPPSREVQTPGWAGLVEQIKRGRPRIGSLLEHGSPIKVELPALEIGFSTSFHLDQMRDPETLAALQDLAEDFFGQPVSIRISRIETEGGGAPLTLAEARVSHETDRQRRLREDALAHPMVKAALEVFDGEVKEIKPIDKGYT
jgi:DNA polymerase III subunit gamma/tau